ncbi:hypothetical protein KUV65_05355 [Maritalea mobilis]|uniref:Lipoprotein n=1 Tax=[Roseibacterium] beibuensis TaxID=1193142 RepID=A0ABP9KX33_9RHOB|nr:MULTISPECIES: hypothetical protein [Alphaproteobacteria]MBY6200779.1 hypothetical protein [Maritalea mobilis]MCS6621827.1 hypothetical protein [Roseibacterium beibuensis]
MKFVKFVAPAVMLALLAGCVTPTPEGETEALSEEILALAAPGQDTTSVRLESDGCYWYRYEGPVETTYLPLMTRDDRMICVVAQ